jgi:tetratricopeptide (TPR) repeat protein
MHDSDSFPWWRKDATIIAVLVALAVGAFTVSLFFTRSFRRKQQVLADRWFHRGETSLQQGRPRDAIASLRTAMLYDPDGHEYRLRLAQALAANGDTDQSIAYFLSLWESQPGNGLLNLELARLYKLKGDNRKASQFYNAAIYGAWDQDPAEQRRRARVEYIDFLLATDAPTQAQAEAIALQAGVPPNDIPNRLLAADLLTRTGEFERALQEYLSLSASDPLHSALGAGEAAFRLGRFRSAARYYQLAVEKGEGSPSVAANLQQSKLVLSLDPFQHRLTSAERARRVSLAYATAGNRLRSCALSKNQPLQTTPPTTGLQKLYDEWSSLGHASGLKKLAADPDRRDQIMDLVSRIEEATSRDCGEPTGPDWALLMLGKFGEGVER